MNNLKSLLSVPNKFQNDTTVLIKHPKLGKTHAKIINNCYDALTGKTVVLSVENQGLLYINERFLERIVSK